MSSPSDKPTKPFDKSRGAMRSDLRNFIAVGEDKPTKPSAAPKTAGTTPDVVMECKHDGGFSQGNYTARNGRTYLVGECDKCGRFYFKGKWLLHNPVEAESGVEAPPTRMDCDGECSADNCDPMRICSRHGCVLTFGEPIFCAECKTKIGKLASLPQETPAQPQWRDTLLACVPFLFEHGQHVHPHCYRGSDDGCYCGLDEAKKLVETALDSPAPAPVPAKACHYCKNGDPLGIAEGRPNEHYLIGDSPRWVQCEAAPSATRARELAQQVGYRIDGDQKYMLREDGSEIGPAYATDCEMKLWAAFAQSPASSPAQELEHCPACGSDEKNSEEYTDLTCLHKWHRAASSPSGVEQRAAELQSKIHKLWRENKREFGQAHCQAFVRQWISEAFASSPAAQTEPQKLSAREFWPIFAARKGWKHTHVGKNREEFAEAYAKELARSGAQTEPTIGARSDSGKEGKRG